MDNMHRFTKMNRRGDVVWYVEIQPYGKRTPKLQTREQVLFCCDWTEERWDRYSMYNENDWTHIMLDGKVVVACPYCRTSFRLIKMSRGSAINYVKKATQAGKDCLLCEEWQQYAGKDALCDICQQLETNQAGDGSE